VTTRAALTPGQLGQLGDLLRRRVRGEVLLDAASRLAHASDASNYRQVPLAIVSPRDADDVEAAVAACRELGAPILPRGAGTSLAGQCCNVAVVLDLARHLDRVVAVDAAARTARVEPGVVLSALQGAAAPHGLRFGPDPSTHDRCTLGGMIGNDACGARSLRYGRTSSQVIALDVLTSDGARIRCEMVGEEGLQRAAARDARFAELRALRDLHAAEIRTRLPDIPRRVSGYALDQLLPERGVHLARSLVGSEGTCALVLAADVALVERPRATCLLVLGFDDIVGAAEESVALLAHAPSALEAMEEALLRAGFSRALLPEGRAWLLVETTGETAAAARNEAQALAHGRARSRIIDDAAVARAAWALREAGVGTTARLLDGRRTWPGWEDAAVAPARLPAYLRAFRELLKTHALDAALYGHFGDGCVHARITFDLETSAGVARFRRFIEEAADLVVAHGGSLSGEHGDGQARGVLLERMVGAQLMTAFRRFKAAWDPLGLMNPGKLVDARDPTDDLRAGHRLVSSDTYKTRVLDGAQRCVGVGKCLKQDAGLACPSWHALRDERHSPRGRARLLEELMRGGAEGLRDDAVRDALAPCLSCKGCKAECPTGVDIALYKAEFLARWHETHPRTRADLAFAHVRERLQLAARMPRLANLAMRLPGARVAAERLLGVSRRRRLPSLPRETFAAAWARAPRASAHGAPLVLFADTFTDHLRPAVGHAAADVLTCMGHAVSVVAGPCCGRPLFEAGLLDDARESLREAVHALDAASPTAPVVVLEPSCASMLRDELRELLPDDVRAASLASRVRFFSEAVVEAPLPPPSLRGMRITAHAHCHEQALATREPLRRALERAGAEARVLDAGCCGMAGSFGLRPEHVDLSLAIAQLRLLPALRAQPATTLLLDGISCREQVEQATGRRTHHLAEILAAAP
jgi:FAD/FMN-containing dehydrogenase/Fe-S oxidoreductase